MVYAALPSISEISSADESMWCVQDAVLLHLYLGEGPVQQLVYLIVNNTQKATVYDIFKCKKKNNLLILLRGKTQHKVTTLEVCLTGFRMCFPSPGLTAQEVQKTGCAISISDDRVARHSDLHAQTPTSSPQRLLLFYVQTTN